VEEGVYLERTVEVVLAVEDGDTDVAPRIKNPLELVCRLDRDRFVPGFSKLGAYGDQFCLRKCNDYCGPGQGGGISY
jgi:hypothetical protein